MKRLGWGLRDTSREPGVSEQACWELRLCAKNRRKGNKGKQGRIIRATISEGVFFREAALRRRNSLGKLVYVLWNWVLHLCSLIRNCCWNREYSASRSRSMLMDLQEKCPHPAREDSFRHFSLNPNENCLWDVQPLHEMLHMRISKGNKTQIFTPGLISAVIKHWPTSASGGDFLA